MIRCLITDGSAGRDEAAWLHKLARWMEQGVEVIQLREPTVTTRELASLTRKALALPNPHGSKILINDRADVALACGADGVHLRDGSVSASLFARAGFRVTVSAHQLSQIAAIRDADYILFAPVFAPLSKKGVAPALGLDALRQACGMTSIPILALGGITQANAQECVETGAAGIAGISYFG